LALLLLFWPLAALAADSGAAPAGDFTTSAPYAILMDYQTGSVIYAKDADKRMEPASMAKLMTLAVVFDELKTGKIRLDDQFFISDHAWKEGGAASGSSTMFAKVHSRVPVIDLLYGLIVQSGNDAAIALAEGIAGSEATFASIENQLAAKIGLTNSHFTNASGLPDSDLYTTPHDLARLARYLIMNYPEYYHIFSVPSFTWNKIKQHNRNTLLGLGLGVDGLKTGHSDESGYGIVLSTDQGGRRLIAVLNGMKTERERTVEGQRILNWGVHGFEQVAAFAKGQMVGYASVYGGQKPTVGLVGKDEIDLYLPKGKPQCPEATIAYKGPLRPPVEQGDQVAELRVTCGGQTVQTVPLYAAETVQGGGFMTRAMAALKQLALGWL
jgi:D-alanyl-D-alanine carboxypeptidase (penicillin-binding protein 5/6)